MSDTPKINEAADSRLRLTPCSAGSVTSEMIREMEAHTHLDLLDDPPKRWQWRAEYLNDSLQNPGEVCECCNVARDGEVMDHRSRGNCDRKVWTPSLSNASNPSAPL